MQSSADRDDHSTEQSECQDLKDLSFFPINLVQGQDQEQKMTEEEEEVTEDTEEVLREECRLTIAMEPI